MTNIQRSLWIKALDKIEEMTLVMAECNKIIMDKSREIYTGEDNEELSRKA